MKKYDLKKPYHKKVSKIVKKKDLNKPDAGYPNPKPDKNYLPPCRI
jgi:hypothetical protein